MSAFVFLRVLGRLNGRFSLRFGLSKFRAFDLTEYEHILLLDSNTLVVSRDVYSIFDNNLDFAGVSRYVYRSRTS